MGLKWTNIKFDIGIERKEVAEASHDPRTREEALRDFLQEEFGEEYVPNVRGVDVMFGYLKEKKIRKHVEKVFEEFDFANKAAVIYCTDNGHIGEGWIFTKNDDNSAELEETYQGYEGARGEDVSGEMEDSEYGISVDPMRYWD